VEELSVDLATARDPAFDWQADHATARDLRSHMRLATGMNAVIAVYRAIDEGVLPGCKLSWPTTIACATKEQARRFMQKNKWTVAPEFEALPEDEPYYLVVTDES
jgi:hypothetical protein